MLYWDTKENQELNEMTMSNRTFGVEIECYGRRRELLYEFLRGAGLTVAVEGTPTNMWVIKGDPTVRPQNDTSLVETTGRDGYRRNRCRDTYGNNLDHVVELTSPVLRGEDGIDEVRRACDVLMRLGFRVNLSCGLHIHIGGEDLSASEMYTLLKRYAENETQIDNFMDLARRGNNSEYCRLAMEGLRNVETNMGREVAEIDTNDPDYCDCAECSPHLTMGNPFTDAEIFTRYASPAGHCSKVNMSALRSHGTIEFRGHHGSVNRDEIVSWAQFLVNFVETSRTLAEPRDNTGNVTGPAAESNDEGIYMGLDTASVQLLQARPGLILLGEDIRQTWSA